MITAKSVAICHSRKLSESGILPKTAGKIPDKT